MPEGTPPRPRTSDASMAATGGTAAAAATAEAEAVVTTTMTTVTTRRRRRRREQQQSTIGHSWISTAFAICLDFNIDLKRTVRGRGTEKIIFIQLFF